MVEFFKANLVTVIICGAILLLAVVGVVVGVITKGMRRDRGWLVRNDKPLKWSTADLPIGLIIHSDIKTVMLTAIMQAHNKLSSVVQPRKLFVLTPLQQYINWDSAPVSHIAVCISDDEDGHCEHKFDKRTGRIISARITIPEGIPNPRLSKVVLHEFCHALGLDHDEQHQSVMHPQIQNRPQGLSDHDSKLLRKAYGA